MAERVGADAEGLARAVAALVAGQVVAFPTDTVYGLGVDLSNAAAIARLYAVKDRPAHLPLIAMIATADEAASIVLPTDEARRLMARAWPGALTLVMAAQSGLPPAVLGPGETLGVRVPDHPLTLALLRAFGRPLATTSANRSGQPAALTADEVLEALGDRVAVVVDGGRAPGGVASTVADVTVSPPRVLRAGPVSLADLLAE
jgi:L-threonylcarbamoyladenylate synthase